MAKGKLAAFIVALATTGASHAEESPDQILANYVSCIFTEFQASKSFDKTDAACTNLERKAQAEFRKPGREEFLVEFEKVRAHLAASEATYLNSQRQ